MKTSLLAVLTALPLALCPSFALAENSAADEKYSEKVWARWNKLDKATLQVWENAEEAKPLPRLRAPDAAKVARAGARLESLPEVRGDKQRTILWFDASAIYFSVAMAWVNEKNGARAYQALVAATRAARSHYQRPLIEADRRPFDFAQDVFRLHAQIIALTGRVRPVPEPGYDYYALRTATGQYEVVFIYGTDADDQRGGSIEDVAADEQRKLIYLLTAGRKGEFTTRQCAEVIARRADFKASLERARGNDYIVLSGVSKFLMFLPDDPDSELLDSFPRPLPSSELKLRITGGKLQQPVDAVAQTNPGRE